MLNKFIEKYKHMRIRKKLLLAFLLVFCLTVAVAVTGIVSLISTRASFSYMIDYPHEQYLYYTDAKYQLISLRHDLIYMAVLADEESVLADQLNLSFEAIEIFIRNLEFAKANLKKDKLLKEEEISYQINSIDYMISGIIVFKHSHLIPFYEAMKKYELSVSETRYLIYRGIAIINPFVEVLNERLSYTETTMRNTQVSSHNISLNMLWLLVGIAVVSACMALFLALYVADMISKPIVKLVEIADNVANGNLDVNIDIESQDETGDLSRRFVHVIGVINMFVEDLSDIGHAFEVDGDTTVRLNESQYKGTYARVAKAINDILEYHVVSKEEILECISNIVDGEYDAPLRQFHGRESRINVSVDILRINVQRMEQIMIQKIESDAANKAKSTFLANMSHEIRTPMNAIMGVTELLLHNDQLPDEIAEGLGKIYTSCDLLLGIINDILDFSKIEAGKLDIILAQYKIASLVNDSIQLNMMRIESKPIEFIINIDENIPANLIGDELRIKQILNNLLSNAFKYTDSGKVILDISFRHIASAAGTADTNKDKIMLVISVQDTGYGMTKEQLNKLFTEYSRFHQKINRTIEGTGLGLSITFSLVELMGGDINVDSEPGVGSNFTIEFPQTIVDSEVIGREVAGNLKQFRLKQIEYQKRSQIVRDPMPYGSVLVVDDVETNLYVAEGLMRLYKLQIESVMSGREAIQKISDGKAYDVIFMDHMMPEMDGIEAVKILRKNGYTQPIVALTANAVSGQSDIFLDNGFDAFISKPIDIRQLNTILNKYIRDKQPHEVIEAARMQNGFVEVTAGTEQHIDNMLIDSFIRDADKAIELFNDLLSGNKLEDENELRKFTICVHGIKSSLANIGEITLSKAAAKLEQDGKNKDIGSIKTSAPDFIKKLDALLQKLKEKQKEPEAGSYIDEALPAEDDIEDLREKILAIQHACSDYDRKLVLDIMTQIKYRSKWTKLVLENIMGYVLHSDFEKAEREAAAYADALYGR